MKMADETRIPSRRQEERTETTRCRILESARKIFVRDGFDAARLEEIAADAGYTRGALYANFKNKEELFVAVAQRQIADYGAMSLEAVRSKKGLEAKTRELHRRMGDVAEAPDWAILMIEFSLFVLRHPQQKKHLAPLHEQLLKGIAAVFEDLYTETDQKPPVPLSAVGTGYYSLIQGLAMHSMLNGELITPKVKARLLQTYIRALLTETAPVHKSA